MSVADGLDQVTVTWGGAGDGGAPVTYEYAVGSPNTWMPLSPSPITVSISFDPGQNSRAVQVFVRASNSQGRSGTASDSGTANRSREPNAPSSVDLTGSGPKTLNLTWPNAEGNGTAVTNYRYRIVRGGTEGDWVEVGLVNSVSITGVDAGQVKVDVQAYNGAGAGWSPSKRSGNFTVEAEAPTTPDPGTGDGG